MSASAKATQSNDNRSNRTAAARLKLRHGEVRAKYTPSEIPERAGNQFIECLGNAPSAKELATIMAYKPPYDDTERQRSAEVRKQFLNRLKRVFVPLTAQHSIANTLGEMIRSGYEHRAPAKPEFTRFLQRAYEARVLEQCVKSAPEVAPMCDSYAIIGVSGVGKTRLVRRALAQFPTLVFHPKLNIHSIPYLMVECPHNGTVKQLILNFFNRLDSVVGTDYESRFTKRRMSVESMIREVNAAAHLYGVGLIVIDEIQHAAAAKNGGGTDLFMNFIVRFVNESVAPVVLIGTMSSLDLMQKDFRIARRTMGALLKNYEMGPEWDYFLKKIWRYQWTQKVSPLTDTLNAVMYKRTQGVLALAVKLYAMVQRWAIDSGFEEITEDLINTVADEEFSRIAPMLDALATGDMVKLKKFGDLYLPEAIETQERAEATDSPMNLADLMTSLVPQSKPAKTAHRQRSA